ncbi:MAG: GMC family oxidoreductase [Bdellovibrionales bacterium]|nr:GMC family oxidoreductase [Bdellovibrionales bacterium]
MSHPNAEASHPFLVIGSGPSGVIAALGLIRLGHRVLMLDCGKTPEKDAKKLGLQNRALPKSGLSFAVPRKTWFGSEFAYAPVGQQLGTGLVSSQARGGLSNVWGAASLPVTAKDLESWPIDLQDLSPHLAVASEELGVAGIRDDLESIFPFYAEPKTALDPSDQARLLEGHWKMRRDGLAKKGFRFGRSRLAVSAKNCGMDGHCLEGCEKDAIYHSTKTLEKLRANPSFQYLSGWQVIRVDEGPGSDPDVQVVARSLLEGERTFSAERVFLAAGPIETTRIVLQSRPDASRTLSLKYHPYFLLPVLIHQAVQAKSLDRLHTLSQLFLELDRPEISDRPVHLQIYTYNSFLKDRLHRVPFLLKRAAVIQGYLHPHSCDPIQILAAPADSAGKVELQFLAPKRRNVVKKIRQVSQEIFKNQFRLGMTPILPALKAALPGADHHTGGQFPMAEKPQSNQTDRLGRISGWKKTHIVDSSVLPDLPTATLTLTVMANSHRIATQAVAPNRLPHE